MLLHAALLLVVTSVPPSVSSSQRALEVTLHSQYEAFCAAGRAAAAEAQRGGVPLVTAQTEAALLQEWKAWVATLHQLSLLWDAYASALAGDDPAFEQRRTSMHQAVRESGRLLSLADQRGAFVTLATHGEEVAFAIALVH